MTSLHLRVPMDLTGMIRFELFLLQVQGKIYCILFGFGEYGDIGHGKEVVAIKVHRVDPSKKIWEKVEHGPDLIINLIFRSSTEAEEQAKIRCIMAQEEYTRLQVKEGESNVVVEKGGNDERKYFDVPLDIAAKIAGRLTLVDYLHLRATCTMFRSVSPPVDWKKKALEGLELPPLSHGLSSLRKMVSAPWLTQDIGTSI
ncbi:hypothetical protein QQP08_021193 [Theobroma cacao]|nr:hypothetical protein QQP08_021193 [Theobroma cacao]